MKIQVEIYGESVEISINKDQKKAIINRIVQYIVDNECSSGETLHQSDECILEAPNCLSDIIDNHIKFNFK